MFLYSNNPGVPKSFRRPGANGLNGLLPISTQLHLHLGSFFFLFFHFALGLFLFLSLLI